MPVALQPRSIVENLSEVIAASSNVDMTLPFLSWVFIKFSIMFEELDLLLSRQVLITKEDNAALGYQKGKLVKLILRKR
jgi:hypothetical protein